MNVNIRVPSDRKYKVRHFFSIDSIILVNAYPIEVQDLSDIHDTNLPFLHNPVAILLTFSQPPTNIETKPLDKGRTQLIIYGDVDVADIHDFQERHKFKL